MRKIKVVMGVFFVVFMMVSTVTAVQISSFDESVIDKTKEDKNLALFSGALLKILTAILQALTDILIGLNSILGKIIGFASPLISAIESIISSLESLIAALKELIPE